MVPEIIWENNLSLCDCQMGFVELERSPNQVTVQQGLVSGFSFFVFLEKIVHSIL